MQVSKFGGASIATPERMRALLPIISMQSKPLIVVVSAYGKTTNALEAIVWDAIAGKREAAEEKAHRLEREHDAYAESVLSPAGFRKIKPDLDALYTELNWVINEVEGRSKEYVYDQTVCIGELLSTTIFSAFLTEHKIPNRWMDARGLIRTDDQYREAVVDEPASKKLVTSYLLPALQEVDVVVTQGFIGSTSDNDSTTLGREGSDYTAALLAAMTGADSLSIWKDVAGLLNADPKQFPQTHQIGRITFHEVIEMAFYGAQVIHPKTIKPLQNANIPLYVKCFLQPEFEGTVIENFQAPVQYPPLIVLKHNQVLLQITSRDFSFITEDHLSRIYQIFHKFQLKVNMMQNAAISLVACVDELDDRIKPLMAALERDYEVLRNEHLSLLTIRHYQTELVDALTQGKDIILEQKTRHTLQMVYR